MALKDIIRSKFETFLQDWTGTTQSGLRSSVDPGENIAPFIQRTMAAPQPPLSPRDTTVKSISTVLPPAVQPAADLPQNAAVPADGGGSGSLTARYVDVSGGTPVTATGTFLTA